MISRNDIVDVRATNEAYKAYEDYTKHTRRVKVILTYILANLLT